jgi:AraC-like DNA-binding protein
MNSNIHFQLVRPHSSLEAYVYCFSSLQIVSGVSDGVIIPNGKIDLIFSQTASHQFQVTLMGLETAPKPVPPQEVAAFFAISFNPLAVEYILRQPVAGIVNTGKLLSDNFWGFSSSDLNDFDGFRTKAEQKIQSLLPAEIDERKCRLFELIFATNGEISVQELADKIFWSQRQISRYFQQQFGLSLKTYCSILRFQASLPHIKAGQLYPQLNFADQSHFIKEIKKLCGVSPKYLSRNKHDRFLQFLAIPGQ